MARRTLFALAMAAELANIAACHSPPGDPPACAIIAPQVDDAPDGAVWGFADLHAHPAIERAFGGRLIWGTAVDEEPVSGAALPRIDACPVETHDRDLTSPIDRAVGAEIFPNVAQLAGFAHAPVGGLGFRPTSAWPNARDIIHQQMNVASIRRAYEGGLRLMFASTTDDQALSALLSGPSLVDGFVPDPHADLVSAKAQLDLIQQIVEQNHDWMWIARSPAEARSIIRSGKLAVVLSLEMNGLLEGDTDALIADYGVRHVLPIHLIDNDVGGTAANGDLFNASSAAVSSIYRSDHAALRYLSVAATSDYGRPLGWPQQIATLTPAPLYVGLDPVPYSLYAGLCYEPLEACSGPSPLPTSFLEFGQQNVKGLCSTEAECADAGEHPGAERIRHLLGEEVIVDVTHMSARAAQETIDVDSGAPLVASHGDIAHLCRGADPDAGCVDETRAPPTERSLDVDAARAIVARHGVLGLGSGLANYNPRTVLAARGGPLVTLSPTGASACVTKVGDAGAPDCAPAPDSDSADPATPVASLAVQTVGGISGFGPNAHPFVRVALRGARPVDQSQERVIVQPLDCSTQGCSAWVALPGVDPATGATSACAPAAAGCSAATCSAFTVDDIDRVTLEWQYLGCDLDCQQQFGTGVADNQCQSTWNDDRAPSWTIDQVDLSAQSSGAGATTALVQLASADGAPVARLFKERGSLVIYERDDRPSTALDVPATGHLLKLSMREAPGAAVLAGASPGQVGANVCVAVRSSAAGGCAPAPPIAAGATECPTADGWVSLNQRGSWAPNVTLYTFVKFPGPESAICGIDVDVLDWDPAGAALPIEEVRVEAIDDPVGHWVRRYAQVIRRVASGQLGTIAFGTDFNGLNGMMDIAENAPPAPSLASACPVSGAGDGGAGPEGSPMAPMRFLNDDGSLGDAIRLEERGLATYGLLADLLAAIGDYPGCGQDVRDSLMLSAEATIRAWEALVDPQGPAPAPLPTRDFDCGAPPGLAP